MSANRSNELIELLENIVLQSGSELSENKNLPAHPDRHQGHGLHQPAQQLRHVRHRQSPSARSCTRRCSSSTRAASSTRSSGWHRSARCTSSSTPTSPRTVLDLNDMSDVDQARRNLVDTRNGRRRRRLRLRLVDRRHYHPRPRGCSRRRRRRLCRRPARRCRHPRRRPRLALATATAGRAVAVASARSITDAAAQPATTTTLAAAAAALAVRLSGTEISVGDLKIRPLISSDFGWRFRPTPYYGWRPR